MSEQVTPYAKDNSTDSKRIQVEKMFNNISPYYDILNRVLSLGIDRKWRTLAISKLPQQEDLHVLDMATGTADVALEILKQKPKSRVTGIDISQNMLDIGDKKILNAKLEKSITLKRGASEKIDFPDNTFDAATVAFGVRNFNDVEKGLTEMARVIKPGGKIIVLEFSRINTFPIKQAFNLYFGQILPRIGKLWSKDPRAYRYLYESVQAFPDGKEFGKLLETAGFEQPNWQVLTFGICTVYTAFVPQS